MYAESRDATTTQSEPTALAAGEPVYPLYSYDWRRGLAVDLVAAIAANPSLVEEQFSKALTSD